MNRQQGMSVSRTSREAGDIESFPHLRSTEAPTVRISGFKANGLTRNFDQVLLLLHRQQGTSSHTSRNDP
jgi:hypothetical protein